jgi:hypothetical protein
MNAMIENVIPQHDLTIPDVIRITGIAKNRAYALRYHGEYKIGNGQKCRRIRREEFVYRRQNGLNITVDD